jgi:hypothetical protein
MTLAVLVSCTVACASATSNPGHGGDQRQQDTPAHVVTSAPATVSVELDDQTRQNLERHLTRGSLTVARLIIRDVRPRAAQALKGVRVFIEKPTANASTPVDDPHYAASFVLGLGASESVLLNAAPALSRLWASGALTGAGLNQSKALRITFVPEAWDFAPRLAADFALNIQEVALDVPRQP